MVSPAYRISSNGMALGDEDEQPRFLPATIQAGKKDALHESFVVALSSPNNEISLKKASERQHKTRRRNSSTEAPVEKESTAYFPTNSLRTKSSTKASPGKSSEDSTRAKTRRSNREKVAVEEGLAQNSCSPETHPSSSSSSRRNLKNRSDKVVQESPTSSPTSTLPPNTAPYIPQNAPRQQSRRWSTSDKQEQQQQHQELEDDNSDLRQTTIDAIASPSTHRVYNKSDSKRKTSSSSRDRTHKESHGRRSSSQKGTIRKHSSKQSSSSSDNDKLPSKVPFHGSSSHNLDLSASNNTASTRDETRRRASQKALSEAANLDSSTKKAQQREGHSSQDRARSRTSRHQRRSRSRSNSVVHQRHRSQSVSKSNRATPRILVSSSDSHIRHSSEMIADNSNSVARKGQISQREKATERREQQDVLDESQSGGSNGRSDKPTKTTRESHRTPIKATSNHEEDRELRRSSNRCRPLESKVVPKDSIQDLSEPKEAEQTHPPEEKPNLSSDTVPDNNNSSKMDNSDDDDDDDDEDSISDLGVLEKQDETPEKLGASISRMSNSSSKILNPQERRRRRTNLGQQLLQRSLTAFDSDHLMSTTSHHSASSKNDNHRSFSKKTVKKEEVWQTRLRRHTLTKKEDDPW